MLFFYCMNARQKEQNNLSNYLIFLEKTFHEKWDFPLSQITEITTRTSDPSLVVLGHQGRSLLGLTVSFFHVSPVLSPLSIPFHNKLVVVIKCKIILSTNPFIFS